MNPEAIGTLAWERQQEGDIPDVVIVEALADAGVTGQMWQPEYREAYEACERVWRTLHTEHKSARRCVHCGGETSKQGATLCRECWRTRSEWMEAA